MIRFLICDTDVEFLAKLAAELHQQFDPCKVEYLYGPSALEVSLRSDAGGSDVLLTEIELRNQFAQDLIRQYLTKSSPLQIIYMTPKIEYCTEVYDTPHCGFLLKPVKRNLLVRDVNRALRLLQEKKTNGIVIQRGSNLHIIEPRSLLYVESKGRVLTIVTDTEALETYDKMDWIAYQLDKRFVHCHKSYLVNMDHVKVFSGDSFQLINGIKIPISQSKRKVVRQEFLTYMGRNSTKK